MKLSIIVPYYNSEKWIGRCLNSLLCQNLPVDDYEIIVVDDGSTHESKTLMRYVEKNKNIRYIHQNNSKQSAARNHGLKMAKGKYVFFCDSDDFVMPNVFLQLATIADKEMVDILRYKVLTCKTGHQGIFPVAKWSDVKCYTSGKEYITTLPNSLFGGPWDFWARRDFLMKHKLFFDEEMWMREDMKHFANMILAAGRVATIEAQVYCYIQHEESIVHLIGKKQNSEKFVDDIIKFIKFCKMLLEQMKDKVAYGTGCEVKIEKQISQDVFIVLHNTVRYADMKRNFKVVRQLKQMQVFPIHLGKKYKILKWLMNNSYLWLCFCLLYNLLPLSLRYKH